MSPAEQVKHTIERLIKAGTSFDLEELEKLYHDDLLVLMIDESGETNTADKAAFKSLFQAKKQAGDPPLNTYAVYHRIDADEQAGHVLMSRRVNLTGVEQQLTLSIDLVRDAGDWRVTREVIFARPAPDA